MRLAATGLVIAIAFAVGAPLYTFHALSDSEAAKPFDRHPPDTARELVAVTLTLAFVDAMRRDDPRSACRLAAADAARVLRCATRHPRVVNCGTYVYNAIEDDGEVGVDVATCSFKIAHRRVVEWQRTGALL